MARRKRDKKNIRYWQFDGGYAQVEDTQLRALLEGYRLGYFRRNEVRVFAARLEFAQVYRLSYLTGLRRKELASLTPRSFFLDKTPPTLTVEAACSKHRRKDVLPLHPELVELLHVWLDEVDQDTPLFPNLDKKKTWLMVKKDLAVAGIPYETEEGIADFHAAGRHTHITELLRNGATLAEARELARHTDVRQTMKYTHIGIHDQAKALSGLPLPKVPEVATEGDWQRIGSGTGVSPCQSVSNSDNDGDAEDEESELKKPCNCRFYVTKCQPKSSSGREFDEWRRRESKEQARRHFIFNSAAFAALAAGSPTDTNLLRTIERHSQRMAEAREKRFTA